MLQQRTSFFLFIIFYMSTGTIAQNVYYSSLLNDSLYFYEAQRSGKLPTSNPVSWRHTSALGDGSDHQIDLSGGYYDAGYPIKKVLMPQINSDYVKFTLPLAHTLTLVAWGAIEWGDGYTLANKMDGVLDMLKWGTDWLIKAHPSDTVLFVQVGDSKIDNNYWGPDSNIPGPRPSYFINQTQPGTDVASLTAAAFASASILFQNVNATYANELISHAEALYSFAETATPWQSYTARSVPTAADYYGPTTYGSHLVVGALWLYRATANIMYLTKASAYYDMVRLSANPIATYDWSDQTGAVYVLGATIDPTTTKYKTAAVNYLNTIIHSEGSPCNYTRGGLLWCGAFSETNSLVTAMDMAFLALMYDSSVSRTASHFTPFGLNQINYLLGQNPMNTPYLVGVHANSPKNPHHAGASGGTDIGNIDTSPSQEKHVLYGAVVGGPDMNDTFFDERSNWNQTEVALDYNAPAQSLFAYQIMTNASNPPYIGITDARPPVSRDDPSSSSNRHTLPPWSIAVIAVIVVGSVLLIALVALLAFAFVRRRHNRMAVVTDRKTHVVQEGVQEKGTIDTHKKTVVV